MTEPEQNRLREKGQTFSAANVPVGPDRLVPARVGTVRAKVFKSGNSLALRLPKGIGFVEGDEVVIVQHDGGRFSLWKEADSHHVLMSLYGSMSPGFMKHGRGDIEQENRSWDRPKSKSAA